jgi:hypothetical protein
MLEKVELLPLELEPPAPRINDKADPRFTDKADGNEPPPPVAVTLQRIPPAPPPPPEFVLVIAPPEPPPATTKKSTETVGNRLADATIPKIGIMKDRQSL